jgi:Cyclin, N-terminal domain
MPRTPSSKVDDDDDDKDRNRKRQRHSVARLPVDESESNSSSSTNLQADFLSEAAVPFSDTTNKPKAATPSKRRKTLGNRVTPSTNKLPRDEVGSTPLPMESSSSSASSKTSGTQPKLPDGVINIYTPPQRFADDNHNSILSLTNAYIKTYGVDYYSQLKEGEVGTSTDVTSPHRSNTSSPVSHADSVSTPNHRVVYLASRPTLGQDGSSSSASTGECMPTQPHLTPKMRAILIDWLIELSEEYKLSESTIFCAVALVNKSLECGLQEDLSQESLTQSPTSISTTSDGRLIIGRDMLQCLGW